MSASSVEPELLTAEIVEQELAQRRTTEAPLRELTAIGMMVTLADVTLYWGHGYAGVAAFLLAAPLIYLLGLRKPHWKWPLWLAFTMLALFAVRLLWLGTPLRVLCGAATLIGFATTLLVGRIDLRALLLPLQSPLAGVAAIGGYLQRAFAISSRVPNGLFLSVGLPVAALAAFGTLFVLANPDMVTFAAAQFGELAQRLHRWLTVISLEEIFFCVLVGLLTAGCLRPLMNLSSSTSVRQPHDSSDSACDAHKEQPAPLYSAWRNALCSVIVLFTIYLIFEFQTLWFRDFPQDFYYAGYAHRGAFWLTVALALATGVLSVIFRGAVFNDPCLPALRRLAWVWCSLNGLLAVAVYNRLLIYIGFSGMTHMRIIGLFGISAVVAGFVLVVWKIARQRDFMWLLRRQIWALCAAVMLYAITPVDAIAASYNVQRIMSGDPSAVMQIGMQKLDAEGILVLPPLLDCKQQEIRAGVRALLAERYHEIQSQQQEREKLGWTTRQFIDSYALGRLQHYHGEWSEYEDTAVRQKALEDFRAFAYQWY